MLPNIGKKPYLTISLRNLVVFKFFKLYESYKEILNTIANINVNVVNIKLNAIISFNCKIYIVKFERCIEFGKKLIKKMSRLKKEVFKLYFTSFQAGYIQSHDFLRVDVIQMS